MLLEWFKSFVAGILRHRSPQAEIERVSSALEDGDYQTVLAETEKIIARYNHVPPTLAGSKARMFFNSSEEYNNFLSRFPQRSFVAWEYPVAPEAHYQRSLAFEHSGRLRSSRAEIEHSLIEFPTSSKYLVQLGFVLLDMKYLTLAQLRFEQAIENDLTSSHEYEAKACLGLGLVCLERGQFPAARRHLLEAWRLGDGGREVMSYLQLVAEVENDPRQRAEFFVIRGHWDQAADAFSDALDINPNDYEMHLGIAYTYKELQELELAEKHLKQAFACNPNSSEVNFALGWVYMLSGDNERAEAELRKAISKNRYDPGPFVGLAMLYLDQLRDGDIELAVKLRSAVNRAMELDAGLPEPYIVLAECYLIEGKPARALHKIHRALALAPTHQEAHVLAAEIYLELGRKRRAEHHLDEAADFGRDTEQMRSLRSRLQDDNS